MHLRKGRDTRILTDYLHLLTGQEFQLPFLDTRLVHGARSKAPFLQRIPIYSTKTLLL